MEDALTLRVDDPGLVAAWCWGMFAVQLLGRRERGNRFGREHQRKRREGISGAAGCTSCANNSTGGGLFRLHWSSNVASSICWLTQG